MVKRVLKITNSEHFWLKTGASSELSHGHFVSKMLNCEVYVSHVRTDIS